MSDAALHAEAEALLRRRLAAAGICLERLPEVALGYAMLLPGARMRVAKVLPRKGPHPRGRTGAMGMHWMLRSDVEDFVVLADTGRELVWLLPAMEFRRLASPQRGGRWHLDWFVVRTGASRLPDEGDMDEYRIEKALERLLEEEKARHDAP